MYKHEGEGAIIGLFFILTFFLIIVYVMFLLATVVVSVAAAGGTLYGGGYAIKNYVSSFKENVVDSNKTTKLAA